MNLQENGNIRAALSTSDVVEVNIDEILLLLLLLFLKESNLKF